MFLKVMNVVRLCRWFVGVVICTVSFVSCATDEFDGYTGNVEYYPSQDGVVKSGIFEGEWRLAPYGKVIAEGQLSARNDTLEFVLPADMVFSLLGLVNEETMLDHPDEPIFDPQATLVYTAVTQFVSYGMQGYSDNFFYNSLTSVSNDLIAYCIYEYTIHVEGQPDKTVTIPGVQPGAFVFILRADQMQYRVELIGVKEQATAQYDRMTGLWSLSIPIDDVRIVNLVTGFMETFNFSRVDLGDDYSAWRLVFSSKRRLD